jgi:hypothetical protein
VSPPVAKRESKAVEAAMSRVVVEACNFVDAVQAGERRGIPLLMLQRAVREFRELTAPASKGQEP